METSSSTNSLPREQCDPTQALHPKTRRLEVSQAGSVVQWSCTCLACTRPWLPSLAQEKRTGGMTERACSLTRTPAARDTGRAGSAWTAELERALGGHAQTHCVAWQYIRDDTLFGHRQSHGRQLPDVVPDCALVHGGEKPPSHRSRAAGLLKKPLSTPRRGHCSRKAPTLRCSALCACTHASEWSV